MITEAEALTQLIGAAGPPVPETVPLTEAIGRFALKQMRATVPLPAFDNSAMDGYAVRAGDGSRGRWLRISGEQPAGLDLRFQVEPGQAVRVFTGAPIPAGTGAVIMQEDVDPIGEDILIKANATAGENIRRAGCEICQGQIILREGDCVNPQVAALLASQGITEVEVGGRLLPGQIYESNGTLIAGLAARVGAKPVPLGMARDVAEELHAKLREGLDHDVLVVSGGVSVGARDLVREELERLGVDLKFWRVAIRPGKPFLFGRTPDCRVFGLPGNPVSAFVTFVRFVRPVLMKQMGAHELELQGSRVALAEAVENLGDRPHYLRGRVAAGEFELCGRQESHALYGLSRSNALLRLDAGARVEAGTLVEVLLV
jgi:molybdopterin molybdotransferase